MPILVLEKIEALRSKKSSSEFSMIIKKNGSKKEARIAETLVEKGGSGRNKRKTPS